MLVKEEGAAEFLVVIPSIRQDREGFGEVMRRVQASFTMPTEFHILDGAQGKPAALNRALAELLPRSPANIYVTMDDDIVPGVGWQERVLGAFSALPRLGVASLWVGEDPELRKVIGEERLFDWEEADGIRYRRVHRGHHIAGALLAFRRELAFQVGPQPITGEKYQVWEDAWRGRKVQSLGWDMAFIDGAIPEYILYQDPPEYLEWRRQQVSASRRDQNKWLKDSGIPDPWHLQLRRWLAKIRGKG